MFRCCAKPSWPKREHDELHEIESCCVKKGTPKNNTRVIFVRPRMQEHYSNLALPYRTGAKKKNAPVIRFVPCGTVALTLITLALARSCWSRPDNTKTTLVLTQLETKTNGEQTRGRHGYPTHKSTHHRRGRSRRQRKAPLQRCCVSYRTMCARAHALEGTRVPTRSDHIQNHRAHHPQYE